MIGVLTCAYTAHPPAFPQARRARTALVTVGAPTTMGLINPQVLWFEHFAAQLSDAPVKTVSPGNRVLTCAYAAHAPALLEAGRPWSALMPFSASAAMGLVVPQILRFEHFAAQLSNSPAEGSPGGIRISPSTNPAHTAALLNGSRKHHAFMALSTPASVAL